MKQIIIILLVLNIGIAVGQEKTNFDEFINNFEAFSTATFSRADIWRPKFEINTEFVASFITKEEDCECEEDALWFRYVKKIECEKYIIALISKSCDIPREGYPYSEDMLFVYSKEGQIIDSKIINRSGDLWEYNLEGTTNPFEIKIEQACISKCYFKTHKNHPYPCEIITCIYSITGNGKIEQKLLSNVKGKIIWDKNINERQIIID